MRCLALILPLLAPAAAEEVLLHEERAWRGVVEVASVSREPAQGHGRERQRERVEFVLLTRPPRRTIGRARLPLQMREGRGLYELSVDLREGRGEEALVRKGRGAGRLHPRVGGYVEPGTGRYRLRVQATPRNLVARTTLSGMSQGRFATWRSITARQPFLTSFDVEGTATRHGRLLVGTKTFVDRRAPLPRRVEVTWRIERIDPVVQGRVVNHLGEPVAGLQVLARTTNAERRRQRLPPLLREARTDEEGRFRIGVFWAHWNVEVRGAVREGVVIAGHRVADGAHVRFDDVPELEVRVDAYRLAELPHARLLERHFQGDVGRYLAYVHERVPERRLARALVPRR
ncbi:MAG: hypothetical protein ACYTEZ_03945 [Planctomycetota bacterium]|jgi:hypothetical protein